MNIKLAKTDLDKMFHYLKRFQKHSDKFNQFDTEEIAGQINVLTSDWAKATTIKN